MTKIIINELNLIENIDVLFGTKIVLYGAGYQGIKTYSLLKSAGITVSYFCDNDYRKCGVITIGGVEILQPSRLKILDREQEIVIIITSDIASYLDEIANAISGFGLRTKDVYTLYGLHVSLAQNINDPRINKNYRNAALCTLMMQSVAGYDRSHFIHIKNFLHSVEHIDHMLLYNPYKVGSMSIWHSLLKVGVPNNHVHSLSDRIYCKNTVEAQIVNKCAEQYRNIMKGLDCVKIISIVREPISREFSWLLFFLDFCGLTYIMQPGESFMQACNKWVKSTLSYKDNARDWFYIPQFDWFDAEMKAVFGVDVFEYPFDREKGYTIIKQDNVELLLMKLEKLNDLETVIGEFVNAPHFKLVNTNESSGVPYKYLYKNVREVIKIPRELVSFYYDGNPRMDHFYTEDEKTAFLKKWEKNITD